VKKSCRYGLWTEDTRYNLKFIFLLSAFEIVLAFSPFGFIVFSDISMTTLDIGVIVAALWGGPLGGVVVGCVFGFCSMWQASTIGAASRDLLFSPADSGNPLGSVTLAVGARVLFGLIAGIVFLLIFRYARRGRVIWTLAAGVFLERIHAMIVYHFMDVIFHVEGVTMWKAFQKLFTPVRLYTYGYTIVIIWIAYMIFSSYISKRYYQEYLERENASDTNFRTYLFLGMIFAAVAFLMILHVLSRTETLLNMTGLPANTVDQTRFFRILTQFMVALFALIAIFIELLNHSRILEESRFRKMEYEKARIREKLEEERDYGINMEYKAEHDELTGALNRGAFMKVISREMYTERPIAFALADIDLFKNVNDTYGHGTGDKILVSVADILRETFRAEDFVFRLGGDEFGVILWDYHEKDSDRIIEKITEANRKARTPGDGLPSVSISAGVAFSEDGYNQDLYSRADAALYFVKRNGRGDCHIFDGTETRVENSIIK